MFPKPDDTTMTPNAPEMGCGDGCGTLPSCAPLAVPYVPFQQKGSKKYNQTDALENGTLFPGLNLPFHMKATAGKVQQTPLSELQALEFVLTELGLYLDTHQDDQEAFQLFQQYVALEKEGRARYEALYGPITQPATADAESYTWLNDPWPWNFQEGGKK